jgi:uncharacterized protein YndB with AHSA1/START domain
MVLVPALLHQTTGDNAMLIRERSIIARPAAAVWPYIATPELFQQWNDKVASMEARERFREGQQFTTHYLWNGKAMQCLSLVTRLEEGRLLELRHTRMLGPAGRRDMEVTERIELSGEGERSTVTKTVTIKNIDIPLLLRPLIWFVTRFGKPKGEDRLKKLCEGKT